MNTLDPKNIEMTREIGAYLEAQGGKTITARDLSTRFHIHPSRVRGCVSLGRTMGMPLCSNPTGYFWSFDQNDIRLFFKLLIKFGGITASCTDIGNTAA